MKKSLMFSFVMLMTIQTVSANGFLDAMKNFALENKPLLGMLTGVAVIQGTRYFTAPKCEVDSSGNVTSQKAKKGALFKRNYSASFVDKTLFTRKIPFVEKPLIGVDGIISRYKAGIFSGLAIGWFLMVNKTGSWSIDPRKLLN